MTYNKESIQTLSEIEHIQLNPSMYVRVTEEGEPSHLVEECLDNALDEVQAGYAQVVAVIIDKETKICKILDNGRGIPISMIETVATKLFSGGKFKTKKTAYKIACGCHGVGLVAVLALSEYFCIEVYRDQKHAKFVWRNCKLEQKIVEDYTNHDPPPFATKVEFIPSKKYWQSLDVNQEIITSRLKIASCNFKDATFLINNKKIKLTKNDFFNLELVKKGEPLNDIISFKANKGDESFEVMLQWVSGASISPNVASSVNLLPVKSGGTHVNIIYDLIRNYFSNLAKKRQIDIQPGDSLCGIRIFVQVMLVSPQLVGQAKEKLANPRKELEHFEKNLQRQIENYFKQHQDVQNKLLDYFAQYRAKLRSTKIRNTTTRRASVKFTKLRDCINPDGELFITEGESAAGTLIQSRDPKKHAIFPLKGKIPSIVTFKDISKNKEISELIQAVGTGVEPHFDINGLRYNKIICATDADADGYHISCLLIMIFAVLTPKLIENGHLYIAQTPLYAVTGPKTFVPIWSEDELKQAQKDSKHIMRFKGLGELNPNQLGSLLFSKDRKLLKIKMAKNLEKIKNLFRSIEEKRKLLNYK